MATHGMAPSSRRGFTMTEILMVRHGQSVWNAQGRWQGQADPPLSDLGRSQADAAGALLTTWTPFDGIATSEGKWDEQIYDVEVMVDGNMAVAWVPYTFYLDGSISHCGINSVMLLHDGSGWKVTQLSDTRRRENCPDPHGG